MKKIPVRGMRDILPADMVLRQYLLDIVERVATGAGYQKIETPAIEHLENLSSNDGGENETLIFKILKRGRSLEKAIDAEEALTDSALRYDLTVPLSRYISANAGNISMPLKTLQIGPVWRADAPQKGRFRQFLQCDMDVIGVSTVLAEMDIIKTTVEILSDICSSSGVSGLTVHLNDRRILLAAASYAGFSEEESGGVLISLDKNDKIGLEGVKRELLDHGFRVEQVEKFITLFERASDGISIFDFCRQLGDGAVESSILEDLDAIMALEDSFRGNNARVIFNPTLVRGMGYYTGPIFECTVDGFSSSVAGGGRYDKMIGKFSGNANIPACGFSIGFERIVTILGDVGFAPPNTRERVAILVERKVSTDKYAQIFRDADALRTSGALVSVLPMAKNTRHQVELLEKSGYTRFEKIYAN